jgi:hypothetical protein
MNSSTSSLPVRTMENMKTSEIACITFSAIVLASLSVPPVAAAAPTGGSPAADTVAWLRDRGYHVVLNGSPNGPLSQCVATGVHGLRDSTATQFATVYVDISCNATT